MSFLEKCRIKPCLLRTNFFVCDRKSLTSSQILVTYKFWLWRTNSSALANCRQNEMDYALAQACQNFVFWLYSDGHTASPAVRIIQQRELDGLLKIRHSPTEINRMQSIHATRGSWEKFPTYTLVVLHAVAGSYKTTENLLFLMFKDRKEDVSVAASDSKLSNTLKGGIQHASNEVFRQVLFSSSTSEMLVYWTVILSCWNLYSLHTALYLSGSCIFPVF